MQAIRNGKADGLADKAFPLAWVTWDGGIIETNNKFSLTHEQMGFNDKVFEWIGKKAKQYHVPLAGF